MLTILGRICTPESLKAVDYDFVDQLFTTNNLLKLEKIVLDDKIQDELKKLNQKDKAFFLLSAQKHFIASAKHVVEKSSLKSSFLKSLVCLHPNGRSSKESCDKILEVSRSMPWDIKTDVFLDEWKLLKLEPEKSELKDLPIDQYWNQFMDLKDPVGCTKYPEVSKVVKACLSLAHGNSDAERGFSASGRTLTSEQGMHVRTDLKCTVNSKSCPESF